MVKKTKDFQKVKLKVGRKVKRQNETIVDLKTRKISLPSTKHVKSTSKSLANILSQIINSFNTTNIEEIETSLENVHDILSVIANSSISIQDLLTEDLGTFEFGDLFGYLIRFTRTIQSQVIPHAIRKISTLLIRIFLNEKLSINHFENILVITQIMMNRNEKAWITQGLHLLNEILQSPLCNKLLSGLLMQNELLKTMQRVFEYFDQLIDSQINIECKLVLINASHLLLAELTTQDRLGTFYSSYEELFLMPKSFEHAPCISDKLTSILVFHINYTSRFLEDSLKISKIEFLKGLIWSIRGLQTLLDNLLHHIDVVELIQKSQKFSRMIYSLVKTFPLAHRDVYDRFSDAKERNEAIFLVEMLNSDIWTLVNTVSLKVSSFSELDALINLLIESEDNVDLKNESSITKLIRMANKDGNKKKRSLLKAFYQRYLKSLSVVDDYLNSEKLLEQVAQRWLENLNTVFHLRQFEDHDPDFLHKCQNSVFINFYKFISKLNAAEIGTNETLLSFYERKGLIENDKIKMLVDVDGNVKEIPLNSRLWSLLMKTTNELE